MKITKELVESLSSDTISKKNYDEIVSVIDDKVNTIWRFILKKANLELDWYAFQNDVSYGHGDGSSGGHFDPDVDKEFIELGGEYEIREDDFYQYSNGFPTELLWADDYKSIVTEHIKWANEQVKLQNQKTKETVKTRKQIREKLLKSIKTKLTSEEIKVIKTDLSNAEKALLGD